MVYSSGSLKPSDQNKTKNEFGSYDFYAKKISFPYEYFNSFDDYYKSLALLTRKQVKTLSFSSEGFTQGIYLTFEINGECDKEDGI